METTETYLNLNSEQFNSWVHEFENKYNKIEKNLLSEEKKEEEDSDSDVSIESVKSEESLKRLGQEETATIILVEPLGNVKFLHCLPLCSGLQVKETHNNHRCGKKSSRKLVFSQIKTCP